MRTLAGAAFVCAVLFTHPLFAQGSPTPAPTHAATQTPSDKALPTEVLPPTSTPTAAPTVAVPLLLDRKDVVEDYWGWKSPRPPKWDADGKRVHLEEDTDHSPLETAFFTALSGSATQAAAFEKSDKDSNKHQWHPIQDVNVCHFREGGRDWWGWRTQGDMFLWVLDYHGRFWWHDNYAGRWLSFYNGYWWWQSPKPKESVQVYLPNGHYYLCSKDGILGDDLWTTGTVESANKPVEKETTPAGDRNDNGMRRGGIGGSQGSNN